MGPISCSERMQRKLKHIRFGTQVDSSRVNNKEGEKWQKEIRVTRIRVTISNPAVRARRVDNKQVVARVAAARVAEKAAAAAVAVAVGIANQSNPITPDTKVG